MTREDFAPKDAAPQKKKPLPSKTAKKPLGRPPAKAAKTSLETKDALARKRRAQRLEASKRPGAFKGQRLWAPQIPGYDMRWVVDEGARLDLIEGEGYYFAEKKMHPDFQGVLSSDTGMRMSQIVNGKNGKPTRQYLMMRPLDISGEVLQEKREKLRARDAGLVAATHGSGIGNERTSSGSSAAYDPTKGNSVFQV